MYRLLGGHLPSVHRCHKLRYLFCRILFDCLRCIRMFELLGGVLSSCIGLIELYDVRCRYLPRNRGGPGAVQLVRCRHVHGIVGRELLFRLLHRHVRWTYRRN